MITCGAPSFVMGVISLIEGIIDLTKTPDESEATDLTSSHEWF